jgi:HSP20 family protein
MAESATKLPVKAEKDAPAPSKHRNPVETLRQEIDRLFDDFRPFGWGSSLDMRLPSFRGKWPLSPAVDLVEKENEYEITAELPGIDGKDVEVEVANRRLTIRGEKSESIEQKDKDYHLSERHYGSFQRSFQIPEAADDDMIEASFSKGVLTVRIAKGPDAQQTSKKIEVKAA